jgi:hypothetical protein
MKGYVKISIGELHIPDFEIDVKNIEIEIEDEYTLPEIAGLLKGAMNNLPKVVDVITDIYKRALKSIVEVSNLEKETNEALGVTEEEVVKGILGKIRSKKKEDSR